MLAKQIKVGGKYRMKVSGKIVTVRVEAIDREFTGKRDRTVYVCTNTGTGRSVKARSPVKFRSEALPDKPGVTLDELRAREKQEATEEG